MATVEKIVRFYDTVLIDDQDRMLRVPRDFWPDLLGAFDRWALAVRRGPIGEVDYLGRTVRPTRPAVPHLQVERIRDPAEQLNQSNLVSGSVLPLSFNDPDDRVSEPTFIVPFGSLGRVAMMSPAVQATRPETLGQWLTLILDLTRKGFSLRFVPVVDPDVLQKIQQADGAVMLEVHLDAGARLPASGGGQVGDAFRGAQQQALEDARVELRWSLGRSGGSPSIRDALKNGALWIVQNAFSTNAKVKLASEDDEGRLVRDEVRSLFEDRITKKVRFTTLAGARATDEVILGAVNDAIAAFRNGQSTVPRQVAGTVGEAQISIEDRTQG